MSNRKRAIKRLEWVILWWKDLSFKPQSSREMNLSLPSAQILHVPKLIDKWLAKKPLKLLLSRHLFWLQVVYSDIFVRKLSTRRFSRFHPHFKPASSVNWRNFMNQTNPPTKKILETSTRKKISSNKRRRPSRVALPPLTQDASGKERFSAELRILEMSCHPGSDWNATAPRWAGRPKPWFSFAVKNGDEILTQLYRDCFINHYKNPSKPKFHGSCHVTCFVSVVLVGPTRCLRSVLLVGHPFAQAATEGSALSVMFQAAKADYNFPATGHATSYGKHTRLVTFTGHSLD